MRVNGDYVTTNGSYDWNEPTHIIVHYTAGVWGVTAEANARYYYNNGGAVQCGTHYFLGDDGVYQSTPENRGAWTNGNYNANTHAISIEVACGTDEPCFTETEIELLTELVCDLMDRYGIPAENVIRHYDVVDEFSGQTTDPHKHCPRPYVDEDDWAELHAIITGQEEPDVNLSDKITDKMIMDGSSYATVGNCLFWGEQNTEKILRKVDGLSVPSVDLDALAEKVAARIGGEIAEQVAANIADRMAE